MKLIFLMMFVFFWQVSASTYSQETKLKLEMRSASVKEVFKAIKLQSEFTFIFSEEDIAALNPVSINAESVTVATVLETCLRNTGLTWVVQDDVIIIKSAPQVSQQQKKQVTGKVTDQNGQPIPGVNIIVMGYNNGTITNGDGYYEVSVPDGQGTLKFSFIGFVNQEIAVNGQEEINVVMQEEVSELDDVIVTGYFQQSKKSFTGSVKQISGEDLLEAGTQNVFKSIQLIDPSFMMIENDLAGSNPNIMPEFNVRGTAAVDVQSEYKDNPNMPIFILDGFEVDAEKIWDYDPYRIKSINILKDAAATAIYGSRAANGVVVITSVTPKNGTINVTYSGDFDFAYADLTDYDLLDAQGKLDLEVFSDHYAADEFTRNNQVAIFESEFNDRAKLIAKGYDTYWLNKPINDVVLSHNHSLVIDGGSESFRYGISMNYKDQNGIMIGSGRDRLNLGMDFQYNHKNLSLRNSLQYAQVKGEESPYGNFSEYATLNPYQNIYDIDGNLVTHLDANGTQTYYNPLHNASLNTFDREKYDQIINNFEIDYRFENGLRAKASFSLNKKLTAEDEFIPGNHTNYMYNSGNVSKPTDELGKYIANNSETLSYEGKLVLSYFKEINKHVISANAIYNILETTENSRGMVATGFANDQMSDLNFAMRYEKNKAPSSYERINRLMGIVGALNYSYDNKYLMDVSYRTDASSAFGLNHNWAPFGAIGLGWNVSEENFLKENSYINSLKIRSSYGYTGTINFDPYQSMRTYEFVTELPQKYRTGSKLMGIGNDDLGWQRTLKRNIGTDFILFKNKLKGSVDYYNDISEDMLISVTTPPSVGFNSYSANLGRVRNAGVEAFLNLNIIRKPESKLYIDIFGSLMHNENTLIEIDDALTAWNDKNEEYYQDEDNGLQTKPRIRYIEGESVDVIWANESIGIDPATGQEIYLNKDGEPTFEWDAENYKACGDETPELLGSFGTNLGYKGWRLNVFFKYRLGGDYYNQTLVDRVENADHYANTDSRTLTGKWKNPGDVALYKDITNEEATSPSSRFIQNYNYLELANVNLSYEFDTKWMDKIGLKRLQMNCYMNDIFRTSTVKTERGINYPFQRSVSVGLRASF